MKNHKITLIFMLFVFISSCSKDDEIKPAGISQEIKDLIYFNGAEDAETVLIAAQGGPSLELATEYFNEVLENVNTSNILAINVHQSQTLNPTPFKQDLIPFSEMGEYTSKSIETLNKIIQYFKNQGRTVYVFGASYGASMVQKLIVDKGIHIADKYLIMIGRLDMNTDVWEALSQSKGIKFENGITPVFFSINEIEHINTNRLAADLFQHRYTELLDLHDNLSMITYVYGKTDNRVGKLTSTEIEFLNSKNVNIIVSPYNHNETLADFIVQGFKEAFGIE